MSGKNWDKTIEAVDVRSNHIKLLTFQASYSLGRPGKNIESRPPSIWEPNKRLSTDMAASCCQSEIRREFLDTSKNYTSNFLTNTDRGRRTRIFEVSRLAEKLVCFAIYPRLRSGSSLELYLLTSPVIQNTFARDWICLTTVADNKVNNMDILGRSEYFGNIFFGILFKLHEIRRKTHLQSFSHKRLRAAKILAFKMVPDAKLHESDAQARLTAVQGLVRSGQIGMITKPLAF